MNLFSFLLFASVIPYECVSNFGNHECLNVKTDLKTVRKRRHLTFPESTNMVLTISLVKAFMTHAPSGWNIALEIDVPYPLPNEEITNRFFRKKLHHKQKRELWERIESALDIHNINGHSCVIRSICEVRNRIAPPGKSLVHDILRVVFMAPTHDDEFKKEMKDYSEFSDPNFCERINDCPFSILDFILALNKQY